MPRSRTLFPSRSSDRRSLSLSVASKSVAVKIDGVSSMVSSTSQLLQKHQLIVLTVEDENHCEFVYLRNFLTRTHLQDLIETTSQIHYETFRAKQLLALKESSAVGGGHSGS